MADVLDDLAAGFAAMIQNPHHRHDRSRNVSLTETPTLTLGTNTARSAPYARERDAARVMRDRSGTRATEDLPISHKCGARWGGSNTSHCGRCCRTFGGVSGFDAHRKNGECLDPESVGLELLDGRAYECWGRPAAEVDSRG